ncbi:MAG: CHASE2 domain-containing protein, partial [Novosphingobium sp.]
ILAPPALDRVGLLLFDSYQRAAPRVYEDAPVKVVDIDDESIRRLGQWPWPRSDIARLIDRLGQAGASVVAFDVVFSEPDRTSPARIADQLARGGTDPAALAVLRRLPDHDKELAQSIAQTPVVLGYFLVNDRAGPQVATKAGIAVGGTPPGEVVPRFRSGIESLPELSANAAGSGSVSLPPDSDGILRSVPLLAQQGDQLLPSLSLEALRVAQQAGSIVVKTSDASGEIGGAPGRVVAIKVGQFEIPTTDAGGLWLHYTKPVPARTIPAWKILDGTLSSAELESAVSGRIVFVGAGAIGLRDLIKTPLGERELGVAAHAQAAEQVILGHFLERPDWAPGVEMTLILVLGAGLALMLPRLGAARGAVLVLAGIFAVLYGSWWAFSYHHYLLDPTYPVLALVLVYSAQTVLVFYREERRRAYIHSAFDRFLSPEMVRRIAADPDSLELGGEEREMTVLFCDVRNFSGISEHLAPKQVIGFLIALLTPLCDVLLARKATIDKFIGDAIVAFWNAPLDDPDQHRNAARAALEMVRKLEALNAGEGRDPEAAWPGPVRIGIGLNSGLCCVGNMGSAQRLSYSLIGDTVNLSSRIEGLTKFYGVPIAIGQTLHDKLAEFAMLELDLVRVVGRDTPERVFVLLGDEELAGSPEFADLREAHNAMLAAYRAAQWDDARAQLLSLAGHAEQFGLSKLYAIYETRIAALIAEPPPAGWDGIYEAREK